MSLVLIEDSATEPVTLAELKEFARIDGSSDDALLTSMGKAARKSLENYLGRVFITQTWELWRDAWPLQPGRHKEPWWDGVRDGHAGQLLRPSDYIELGLARVQSVLSFVTYNMDNVATTFSASNYLVDTQSEPGRLVLNSGSTWPDSLRNRNAIKITFEVGYGDTTNDVPEDIRSAIKMLALHLYETRCGDGKIPQVIQSMVSAYKIWRVA